MCCSVWQGLLHVGFSFARGTSFGVRRIHRWVWEAVGTLYTVRNVLRLSKPPPDVRLGFADHRGGATSACGRVQADGGGLSASRSGGVVELLGDGSPAVGNTRMALLSRVSCRARRNVLVCARGQGREAWQRASRAVSRRRRRCPW